MASKPDFSSDDYYKVLGLPKTASEAEISKAYKKLALKHHPDKNPDDKEQAEQRFKKISEAYSVLSDVEKRKTYDQLGKDGLYGRGGSGSSGGNFDAANMAGAHFSSEDADRLFRACFGGGGLNWMPGARVMFMDGNGMQQMMGGGFGFPSYDSGSEEGDEYGSPFSFQSQSQFANGIGMHMRSGAGRSGAVRRGRASRASRASPYAIPQGTTVVVHGLTRAQQHNGKTGEVVRFNEVKGRYDVAVEGQEVVSLRPCNITQCQEVEIIGLTQKPELNGKRGTIFNYQEDVDRYQVQLGSQALSLQPGKCLLKPGTNVVLRNLSDPRFNGEMATILQSDQTSGRYQVRCRSGGQVSVKFEKVLC